MAKTFTRTLEPISVDVFELDYSNLNDSISALREWVAQRGFTSWVSLISVKSIPQLIISRTNKFECTLFFDSPMHKYVIYFQIPVNHMGMPHYQISMVDANQLETICQQEGFEA